MIVPDVNLLLYAHLTGFLEHTRARRWWEGLMNGFIRLATSRAVFDRPLTVADALGRVDGWLALPHVLFVLPGPRHLEIAFGLLRELGAAANLTTDVQLAAVAIEHQGELHSSDTDFGRFGGLRWVNPLR